MFEHRCVDAQHHSLQTPGLRYRESRQVFFQIGLSFRRL